MSNYAENFNPSVTPQTQAADPRQVENNAGGFTFQISIWDRLDRFLVLGSDANTYYQTARDLTRENGKVVIECFKEDFQRAVDRVVEISDAGRAPKNDPAIFVLALGSVNPDENVRRASLSAMPKVCRTATHLFIFVDMSTKLGKGWGRAMKRAVSQWYDDKDEGKVAYQMIKYRNRAGFDHNRLIDLSHPSKHGDLYQWIVGKKDADHPLVQAHLAAMKTEKASELLPIISENKLPWEALPTWALKSVDVYKALLPDMPMTALIRQLGKLTSIGVLSPMSKEVDVAIEKLSDEEAIKKSRIHPFSVLQALSTYQSGHGFKGSLSWSADRQILDVLDSVFYKAFDNVEPTGKRHLLALDVSGSMCSHIQNSIISARVGSAAMAMVTVAAEPKTHVVGFTGGYMWRDGNQNPDNLTVLNVSPRQRLDDVVRSVSNLPFGSTDCALPMMHALAKGLEIDVFVVYTDNETWAGSIHPHQALNQYRQKTGIDAKLIVVGMTSTGFSIADPSDPGMLDVVGFDSAAPAVMSEFSR